MSKKVLIITPDITFKGYFREIMSAHKVLFYLVGREILSCYKQTTFGILWAFLQPLSMMLILAAVYRHYIPTGDGGLPYAVFVLGGLLPWQLFTRTIESASASLLQHKNLITKIYIPRIFLPVSNSIVGFIDAIFGIILLIAVMIYYHLPFRGALWLLPVFLCYSYFCALGMGLILSVLNVQYRDVQYAIPYVMRLFFFLTPITYPASFIPAWLHPVYFLNPLAGALELVRWTISGEEVNVLGVLVSFGVSTLLFFYAIRIFQRMEYRIVDIL